MLPTGVSNWIHNSAPPAISGSGGHDATYTVACALWRMLADESVVWAGLCEYNATRCQPAWTERELRHKLADAEKATRGERQPRPQHRAARSGATLADMRRMLAQPPKVARPSAELPDQPAPVAIPECYDIATQESPYPPLAPSLLAEHMAALPKLPDRAARDFERVTRILAGDEVAAQARLGRPSNVIRQTSLADGRVLATWHTPKSV
jgi:hypothetical protein